jgi:hypothetical protein
VAQAPSPVFALGRATAEGGCAKFSLSSLSVIVSY